MSTARPVQSIVIAASLALATIGVYSAGANNRPMAPAPTVVAMVDMEKLINSESLAEVKARNEVIKIDMSKKQTTLDEMSEKLKKLKADLEMLNKESIEYRNTFAQALELEEHAKSTQKIYRQLLELDSGEVTRIVYEKVRATIAKVSEKDGYSLVILDDRGLAMPKSAPQQEMNSVIFNKRILYAAGALDITDRIITEMNNEYNAPAPRK